jgi:hypothetical protein
MPGWRNALLAPCAVITTRLRTSTDPILMGESIVGKVVSPGAMVKISLLTSLPDQRGGLRAGRIRRTTLARLIHYPNNAWLYRAASPGSGSCSVLPTARACSPWTSGNRPPSRKTRPGFAGMGTITAMADDTDILLPGFAGFEASERYLRSLDDDIWVSRRNWKQRLPSADRPEDLNTGDAMRAELERPSLITVVSAHAGSFDGPLGFCGEGEDDDSVLTLDSIRTIGATSMLLIDACHGPALAAELKKSRPPRSSSVIAVLDYGQKEQFTQGRVGVTVSGSVIRELCYPIQPDLGELSGDHFRGRRRRDGDVDDRDVAAGAGMALAVNDLEGLAELGDCGGLAGAGRGRTGSGRTGRGRP